MQLQPKYIKFYRDVTGNIFNSEYVIRLSDNSIKPITQKEFEEYLSLNPDYEIQEFREGAIDQIFTWKN